MSQNNTRWWESYLVRYLSGSILGSISIILLAFSFLTLNDSEILNNLFSIKNLSSIKWKYFPTSIIVITLLILGFLYSYLISSPITVIHYARGGKIGVEKYVRHIWFGWLQLLIIYLIFNEKTFLILFIVSCISLISLGLTHDTDTKNENRFLEIHLRSCTASIFIFLICNLIFYHSGVKSNRFLMTLLIIGFPTITVGVMQYATLFRVLRNENEIHQFYKKLIDARMHSKSREIRETYTHLREHSNSSFIVIIVICFTSFLIFLARLIKEIPSFQEVRTDTTISYFLCLLIFWLLPNLFMWSRANNLERDFSKNPENYLGQNKTPDNEEIKSFSEKNVEQEIINGDKVKIVITEKITTEKLERKDYT